MKQRHLYIPILFLFLLSFVHCAKKGTPGGGSQDTIPPVIVRSSPENYSINFSGDQIEIRFDEYIKLKDINKQLIISPPMKLAPIITPLSTSKTLKIQLLDTLKPNTTYSFNFGNSIVDNNEGNVFEYYKYVFSTGTFIDSLTVSGKVQDAQLIAPEIPTTVMLYEVNEGFKDSLIYSEKPTYITATKDSTGTFELTNLKEGKYLLLALKEKNNDYIFQPQTDKIGFYKELITVPTDSIYNLTLFKEKPDYKLARPSQVGKNQIVFGYQGNADSLNISLLTQVPENYESTVFRDQKKDTLHYWYKPAIEIDSLIFKVKNKSRVDTVTVRMRELYSDSLKISPINTGTFRLTDTLKFSANVPLISIDAEQIGIMAKDSTKITPQVELDAKYNLAKIFFPKKEEQGYKIRLLPEALTDFFGKTNDTINLQIKTKPLSDYGTMNVTLNNVGRYPVILQLLDKKYMVIAEKYLTEAGDIFFDDLAPDKYFLRIIYDDNKNGKWDTGSFLNRRQPEKIIYYPTQIEVRANWSLNENFTLK